MHEFPVCVNVRDVSHRGLNMPGLAVYSFRSFMLGLNGWLPLEVIAESVSGLAD